MSEEITILGAGHQGVAMAAHLGAHGVRCNLWNRSADHIRNILNTKQIICSGILEGAFSVNRVSAQIEEVLTKVIMVTTPSSAHKDLAKLLAPYMDETYTIILNPGRTFGILEFLCELKKEGCISLPCVAETQTILYTCRREPDNSVRLYALKKDIPISTVRRCGRKRAIEAIPQCIRNHFVPVDSYMKTSMGNVGMVLHCAPVLMNIGWIENKEVQFEYYYDGISPSIANVLEKLDAERLRVAEALGHPVESLVEWLQKTYQTRGADLYEHLQSNSCYRGIDAPKSIHHRYIEEDIPNGLVPLEDVGRLLGIDTPTASAIISFANMVMDCDYRETGRHYSVLREIEEESGDGMTEERSLK